MNRLTGLRWWKHLRPRDDSDEARQKTDRKVAELLRSPLPSALGKIGTTELMGLEYQYRWIQPPWPSLASWKRPAERLHECSGLFPVQKDIYEIWSRECRSALEQMDLLAQWQSPGTYLSVVEDLMMRELAPHAFRASIHYLQYWNYNVTWLGELAQLKWLVIHPFAQTIRFQLPNLARFGVFPAPSVPFLEKRAEDTRLIACPQFSYMVPPRHPSWRHALEDLKQEMEREDFDVALVGAGAWSLPLVTHAKKLGKKGMHLGGSLQLLFGIKGGRYDSRGIYNSAWIRPLPAEIPANFRRMEKGAYW